MLYSKVNDPSTFDIESFEFKDAEEAKRCAEFLNQLLMESEIDRAMQWCVEYLRWCEVEADKDDFPMSMNDYARLADDTIDTCIRYLEKVERELDRDNERP